MQVSILEFGARISSIKLPVQGQLEEMTLTYKDSLDYLNDDYFIGAKCGPVKSFGPSLVCNRRYALSSFC